MKQTRYFLNQTNTRTIGVSWDIHSRPNWNVWSTCHILSSICMAMGYVSGLPIPFWTIAWADGPEKLPPVFVQTRSPAALGFCRGSCWDSDFIDMSILVLIPGEFLVFSFYILSITIKYLGHSASVKIDLFAILSRTLRFFSAKILIFFTLCNIKNAKE